MEMGQGGGGDDDEAEPEPVPSFTQARNAFQTMKAFMYARDITEIDQTNIVNIESILFSLKRRGATNQMTISDCLKNK